jgi:tetratricopeptide (TPR) repeat protein
MFFPKLRRRAKWMFVFLALVFGLGFVIFGVGGNLPGTGLGDIFANLGQDAAGPSEGDARDDIKDNPNDPQGYYDLAQALQRDGKGDEAIQPLERYVGFRPKDRNALNQLAGLYLTQARQAQEDATLAQFELTQITGGDVFVPGQTSPFGQEFGNGKITEVESQKLNQRLSDSYVKSQQAYQNATETYKKLVAAIPDAEEADQPSVFLQLAFAAQSGNNLNEAIKAYQRYLKIAPDSPNAPGVRDQIKQLQDARKAQEAQSSRG